MLARQIFGRNICSEPRRISLALAILTVAAFVSPCWLSAFEDSIEEKLSAAKEKYEKGLEESKAPVVARFRELISILSEKKMIEQATRTQDEMKIFEKEGIILARGDMLKAFQKYGETRKKMGDELTTAYTDAAASYAKAGNLDKADQLRKELHARSLPSKTVSIKLFGTNGYMMHGDYKGILRPAPTVGDKLNGTFEIVNGLSESGYVSIRSVNLPNHYLNHGNMRILLSKYQDSDGYRQNSTFKRVKGLSAPSGVSFESVNFPGHYIRVRKGELWVDKETPKDGSFRRDATFYVTEPLLKIW